MPMVLPFVAIAFSTIGTALATVTTVAGVLASEAAIGLGLGYGAGLAASIAVESAIPALLEMGSLAGVSALLAPHPKVNTAGSPQMFKSDPNAPVPNVMGRYGIGGYKVYETASGGSNKAAAGAAGNEYQTVFAILSGLGPIQNFESTRFNDTILTFNGQTCSGGYIPQDEVKSYNPGYTQNSNGSYANNIYSNHAWLNVQLGEMDAGYFAPPDKLLTENGDALTEWTPAHGFNSFAALALTVVYDQTVYAGAEPQFLFTLSGYKVYDPRKDSTYPGGVGSHRWAGLGATGAEILAARDTWEWSDNPHLHALNYALGYYYPDPITGLSRLYAGIGAGPGGVVTSAFVRAANVADANDWKICGQWTTGDGKWSVLTAMLGAGGGTQVFDRGLISCIVSTPLTSLGTVTAADLAGKLSLDTGSSRTARLNTIFPRYSSEAHRWQLVQADTPVMAQTYVAEDGGVRSKTVDWEYVPAVNQACQLAAYTITDGREIPGIVLVGKPKLRNYDVGDCFTVDIDEGGLALTKVMVTKRATAPATGVVTLTVRTETDAKHPYSLGLTGVAPATPGISGYDPSIVQAPLPDNWATGVLEISDPATGEATSLISVVGSSSDNVYAQTVVLRWRPGTLAGAVFTPTGSGAWTYRSFAAQSGSYQLDLNAGAYDVQIGYVSISGATPTDDAHYTDLGVEVVGGSTAANAANVGGRDAATLTGQVDAAAKNALDALALVAPLQPGIDTNGDTLAKLGLALGALQAYVTAQTTLNNVSLGTIVSSVSEAYVEGDQALADTLMLIGVKSGDSKAFVINGNTLQVSPGVSLGATLAQLTTQTGPYSTNYTAEVTARTNADGALQTQLNLLGVESSNGKAWIMSQDTVQVSPGVSLAQHLNYVTSTLGNGSVTVSQLATAVDGQSGRIAMAVNANGQVVGLDIGTGSTPNSGYFDIVTPRLRLVDPSNPNNPTSWLNYSNGLVTFNSNVVFNGNSVFDGTLTTSKAAANMITNSATLYDTTSVSLGGLNATPVLVGTISYGASGGMIELKLLLEIANTDASHDENYTFTVYRDGNSNLIETFYGWTRQNSAGVSGGWKGQTVSFLFDPTAGSGLHTWTVYAQATAGAGNASTKTRTRISLTEFKDQ